jgi:hypothetical protein
VTVRNPFAQPLSFLGLEIVVLACGALTLMHAVRALRRERDALPLFTWVAVVSYGLVMEIVSYNYIDSFTHGPFTVMLYHDKLPLYVVAVYPALLYTGIAMARRLGLSRAAEPFVAGLAIVLLDFPFDVLGPPAGWWSWSPVDPNIRERWEGVPLTSYYWHITFGGSLALLTRSLDRWLARGGPAALGKLALAPIAGALTLVVGGLTFVPFHILKKAGVSDAANLALLVAMSAAVLLGAKKARRAEPDRVLRAIPIAYHLYFVVVVIAFASRGALPAAPDKTLVILLATACSLALHAYAGGRTWSRAPLAASDADRAARA